MLIGKASPEDMNLHPIQYQWAYDLYQQAVRNTWFPHEIALKEDLVRLGEDDRGRAPRGEVPDGVLQSGASSSSTARSRSASIRI